MSSPLPPDPYAALSLSKDATSAQIKTIYRKLVLKCHPDKVTDPSLKAKAADDFHRIQQAYEILSDDDRRARYDAQVKLAELRKDVMEKQRAAGPRAARPTAEYEVPTANSSSPRAAATAYSTRGPERIYEERKPSKAYEADYEYFPDVRGVPRKHEDYEKTSKRAAPKEEKDRDRARVRPHARSSKESDKSSRDERRRTRDKETKRERESKFPYVVGDDTDPEELAYRAKYGRPREEDLQRRMDSEKASQDYRERRERETARMGREQEREAADRERRGVYERKREKAYREDGYDDRYTHQHQPKSDEKFHAAKSYIDQAERHVRPQTLRAASARDPPHMERVERTREGTPVMIRSRTSTRPTVGRGSHDVSPPPVSKRERERKYSVPDLDYSEPRQRTSSREPRPTPSLYQSFSSPPVINPTRDRGPIRSQSLQADYDHPPPPKHPQMSRSDTMPNLTSTSPRRKDASAPLKSSGLRNTEINEGLPTPSTTPEYIPSTTRKYRYPDDAETSNGKHTVILEPHVGEYERERERDRRSSPPRHHPRTTSARYAALPQLRTQGSYHPSVQTESPTSYSGHSARPSPRRETSESLYGEILKPTSANTKYDYSDRVRDDSRQRHAHDPEPISSKKFGLEDARMQSGYTTSSRRGGPSSRPNFSRARSYQQTAH